MRGNDAGGQWDRGGAYMIRLWPAERCRIRVVNSAGREIFSAQVEDFKTADAMAAFAIDGRPNITVWVHSAFGERAYWQEKQ